MLKLPSCPYCGKQFGYKASAAMTGQKTAECRKCRKLSQIRFKAGCAKMAAVFAAVLIAINTLMIFSGNNKTLIPNFVVTVAVILVFIALVPLKVKLLEIEGQREPEPKLKKNRHRRKKTRYEEVKFKENPLEGTSFDD